MIEFRNLKQSPNSLGFQTLLYIVHFIDENFYKVGITTKHLDVRFHNYPRFETVQTWDLPTAIAETVERQVVLTFHNYSPGNWKFNRPGQTECFRTKDVQKVVTFIEQRVDGNLTKFYINELPDGTYEPSLKEPLGIIKFQREVPLHLAVELMQIAQPVEDLVHTAAKVIRRIRR
jgi:hypothetical protein